MDKSKPAPMEYFEVCRSEIEQRLVDLLQDSNGDPAKIYRAMRYSLLAGGKRLRAILMMAVADVIAASHAHVLDAACALEMIHAYSLIHDDLPCMDDDDFRRGVPTSHRVFGEAMAVLAGDGLLTFAFSTLAGIRLESPVTAERLLLCIAEIARGAGPDGMVGGQVLDIASTGDLHITREVLEAIHSRKTGSLFRAAVRSSAILSGASENLLCHLSSYAEALGLTFQIRDDILNVVGDERRMGKRISSDAAKGKATYPAVAGVEGSRHLMDQAVSRGRQALAAAGFSETMLGEILDYAAYRDH